MNWFVYFSLTSWYSSSSFCVLVYAAHQGGTQNVEQYTYRNVANSTVLESHPTRPLCKDTVQELRQHLKTDKHSKRSLLLVVRLDQTRADADQAVGFLSLSLSLSFSFFAWQRPVLLSSQTILSGFETTSSQHKKSFEKDKTVDSTLLFFLPM